MSILNGYLYVRITPYTYYIVYLIINGVCYYSVCLTLVRYRWTELMYFLKTKPEVSINIPESCHVVCPRQEEVHVSLGTSLRYDGSRKRGKNQKKYTTRRIFFIIHI